MPGIVRTRGGLGYSRLKAFSFLGRLISTWATPLAVEIATLKCENEL
jgi:hypothetical protein